MSLTYCKFLESPYFVPEVDNWHLLPGAPEDIVSEFYTAMISESLTKEEKNKWKKMYEKEMKRFKKDSK